MRSKILICKILAVVSIVGLAMAGPCPVANSPGSIFSDRLIAAFQGGVIPITQTEDSQCYNYSLPYAFKAIPDVAVSFHDFEADPSKGIYFFIKPIRGSSPSAIPFVVRTQWSYTSWIFIGFSFLVEDRADIEAGYYQIDSGSLSSCENGKEIQVLLPFKNAFAIGATINHHLFLHGFEVTTVVLTQNSRSPFELQISSSSTSTFGITAVLQVTTITKVDSIFISYLAYQTISRDIEVGSFMYDATAGGMLSYKPSTEIPRSYARLYGLSGFIMNYHSEKLSLMTKWDGFSFSFLFNNAEMVKYFTFNYIFFVNSECQDCPGYNFISNGTCVNFCPTGEYPTALKTCVGCGTGRTWNGETCILDCAAGQYLNKATNKCQCPPSLNWNGEMCISCTNGKIWDSSVKSCQCPRGLRWNGFACAKLPECTGGQIWDVYTFGCKCQDYQYWSAGKCIDIPTCKNGQILVNYQCRCPDKYIWNTLTESCTYTPCFSGQVWTGSTCVCPPGKHFNKVMCVECINGQVWNSVSLACECEGGYKWNGQFCERTYECTGNRVWNQTFEKCVCPASYYWSGYACLPQPTCTGGRSWISTSKSCLCYSGSNWNGTNCVVCTSGKIWSQTTLSCGCPPGAILNSAGECYIQQQCTGGRTWIQNLWRCDCPLSTVWNGNFCIVNPCDNGRVWDETKKSCVCPENRIWMNFTCLPPQISCTNGRVWNPNMYACQCPVGTYPNVNKCDAIPVCNNGRVYNPLNNQCNCPFGLVEQGNQCKDPACPNGQYWNSYECVFINCPPPSFFHVDRCVYKGTNKCPFGYLWNGQTCIYYPSSCPAGSTWTSGSCHSSQCGNGFYMTNQGQCSVLPQMCTPPTTFNGNMCVGPNNACPNGTYVDSNNRCLPYVPCRNGFLWDANYLRCVCPAGMINNGNNCVSCPTQKVWDPIRGCTCPEGSFDTGSACETVNEAKCSIIPNAVWDVSRCLCRPGFTKVDLQCVCYGTQSGNLCDKCAYKPNSDLNPLTDICECRAGFTQINDFCVPRGQTVSPPDDPTRCAVGTFFDKDHRMCLACPAGCLSCADCYHCKTCRPEFIFDSKTQACFEMCGDGKKFIHACDDGNNRDGDGCSRDCLVEAGYTCSGGSPDSPDQCFNTVPSRVTIAQLGQVRLGTSIVIHVRVNYIPNSLLLSQECKDSCSQVLVGRVTSGDSSTLGITSKYMAGSTFDFTVTVEFGRSYMGQFNIQIDLNRPLLSKFFGSIPIDPITITVTPNYLAAVGGDDERKLS